MIEPRRPTLYRDASWRRKLKPAAETLLGLLTRFDRPCVIHIPPTAPHEGERRRLARGEVVSRYAAMNYGYIFGLHATFVFDEVRGLWYEISNKRSDQRLVKARATAFTFSEVDKVDDQYFFDGNVKDILRELLDHGWTFQR